tara:strand:- start:1700 stop:1915 length:216 start_codon:yes stop_codon:yes gene_type:complete
MEKYELENLDDIDLEMLYWILNRLLNSPEMSISKYIKNSGDTLRLRRLKMSVRKALKKAIQNKEEVCKTIM